MTCATAVQCFFPWFSIITIDIEYFHYIEMNAEHVFLKYFNTIMKKISLQG